MRFFNVINSLNQGKGVRFLTEEGSKKYHELVKVEKKKRGIPHKKDVSKEPWVEEIKNSLFLPEYEGVYWKYAKAVKGVY